MVQSYRPLDYGRFNIPEHMKGGLDRYVRLGIRPGDFLQSVLCNDFAGTILRADHINKHALHEYALILHSGIIPADAWGSREAVERWIAKGGERGKTET